MRVLVVDTALDTCTAAVFEDGRMLGVRSEVMARGHSERLGGFVRDAVAQSGGGFEALDRIGVTIGPGSFTGLRVGLAFAQGLGAALGLPVVGISTLQALAHSKATTWTDGLGVAAVIDARRGQVYMQTFRDARPDAEAEALSVEDARRRLVTPAGDAPWSLVGSGASLIAETAESDLITAPTVEALAALTAALDPAANPPRPLYLRAPDATPPTRLPGQARTAASGT